MACSALYIASLNSGSNGNCYYVGNEEEAILIDAGISCRETEKRLARLNLPIGRIKAIFISHEHTDHIRGLCTLAAKHQLPVYISSGTLLGCRFKLKQELVRELRGNQTIQIGRLRISSFLKLHDAAEPHSFMVSNEHLNIGIFTDIGHPCEQLIFHFQQCHAAFLEANYDDELLAKSAYPYFLKRRISGGRGHLSNQKALELFLNHRPSFMSHLLLAHLSQENNSPELVQELFDQHAGDIKIAVASRHGESEIFEILAP